MLTRITAAGAGPQSRIWNNAASLFRARSYTGPSMPQGIGPTSLRVKDMGDYELPQNLRLRKARPREPESPDLLPSAQQR